MNFKYFIHFLTNISLLTAFSLSAHSQSYPIVGTGVTQFYSDIAIISEPSASNAFFGQDAHYPGTKPSYTNNDNGTITDNISGLMWEKSMGDKISFDEAFTKAANSDLGEYDDWRVPTIKELYSLIQFTGQVAGQSAISFFIDTYYFDQALGNTDIGEREIDAQTWSSTEYVGLTMKDDATVFGVNFVDGRIKGYPKYKPATGAANKMYFRMVRGNSDYGENTFADNNDGTVTDLATGLMWQKADDGNARNWEEALDYAEKLELAYHEDWRLPNAKELQSIVDYSRSPQTTNSPAIDPIFETTEITDPNGNDGQYPFFWTGTTHLDGANPYTGAVYIAFGEGLGKMNEKLMDVHGAGCQRSDPKSGDIDNYPQFFGPQGDVRYVYNYVRCVRNTSSTVVAHTKKKDKIKIYPNPSSGFFTIALDEVTSVKIKIRNQIGSVVQELELLNTNLATINIQNLSQGIYSVNVCYENERITNMLMNL